MSRKGKKRKNNRLGKKHRDYKKRRIEKWLKNLRSDIKRYLKPGIIKLRYNLKSGIIKLRCNVKVWAKRIEMWLKNLRSGIKKYLRSGIISYEKNAREVKKKIGPRKKNKKNRLPSSGGKKQIL